MLEQADRSIAGKGDASLVSALYPVTVSLRRWFFYPAKLACRAEPLEPTAAVRSFISKHYVEDERTDHWFVLRRLDDSAVK